MGGGPPPAQGGTQILGKAEAGVPLCFGTSLSSCSSSSSTHQHENVEVPQIPFIDSVVVCFSLQLCDRDGTHSANCSENQRFTGAVLGDVVDTPVDVSTTGVTVQTVQKTVWRKFVECV